MNHPKRFKPGSTAKLITPGISTRQDNLLPDKPYTIAAVSATEEGAVSIKLVGHRLFHLASRFQLVNNLADPDDPIEAAGSFRNISDVVFETNGG